MWLVRTQAHAVFLEEGPATPPQPPVLSRIPDYDKVIGACRFLALFAPALGGYHVEQFSH
jgi:hypothetical protein